MAASLVDRGKTVCDVGCDHGKLSLYLLKERRAEQIIATDINPQPLQKAVQLLCENGMGAKAEFLLTDGLQGISKTEDISHIVIAGLGGETMASIISKADFVKHNKVELILIPAQSGAKLRSFLYKNGFTITLERTVAEKKKFYCAIMARYTGKVSAPTIFDCYIGEARHCEGDSAIGYFQMVLSQLTKRRNGQMITYKVCDEETIKAIEEVEKLTRGIQIK